jgi:hypothetical protein
MTRGSTRAAAVLSCLLAVVVTGALAWGKAKIVTPKNGKPFEGEVTESGDKVIITLKTGQKVTIYRDNIESIVDAPSVEEQFKQRMAKLSKKDSAGHVELARWAIDRREYSLALDALDAALAIDPSNEDAIQLARTVEKQRRLAPAAAASGAGGKQGARPAGGAATPAGRGPRDPAAPAEAEDPAPAADARAPRDAEPEVDRRPKKTRLVTNDEINRIRQLELSDNENVTIRLQNDVKQRYLSSSDWDPKEFHKLTPAEQGMEILKNGLHQDVVIATDPASMAQFKSLVQRNVLTGCATASCHGRTATGAGGEKGGRFVLHHPAEKASEMYTNFLLMQDYRTTIDGKERFLIDRQRPADSLVLQYGLPPRGADTPHPEAQNFRPMYKGRNDPKFRAIEDWIANSLAAVPPDYDIDLTKAPPGATTRPSRDERATR